MWSVIYLHINWPLSAAFINFFSLTVTEWKAQDSRYHRQRRIHLCCFQKSLIWKYLSKQDVTRSLDSDMPWCPRTSLSCLCRQHYSAFRCSLCVHVFWDFILNSRNYKCQTKCTEWKYYTATLKKAYILKCPYYGLWKIHILVLGVPNNRLTCMQGQKTL